MRTKGKWATWALILMGGILMAKTLAIPWATYLSGAQQVINIPGTHIDSVTVQFRGMDGPVYSSEANVGAGFTTLPATPAGCSFEQHGATASYTFLNDSGEPTRVRISVSPPWGSYASNWVYMDAGATATLTISASASYFNAVGQGVGSGYEVNLGSGPSVTANQVGASTTGSKTLHTLNPSVTELDIMRTTTHVGELLNGEESPEYEIPVD